MKQVYGLERIKPIIFLLGLCCILTLALPGCSGGTTPVQRPVYTITASWLAAGLDRNGWPTFGYDPEHSGMYPSPETASPLRGHLVWQQNLEGAFFSAPVLSNDVIYAGSTSGGSLLALNAQSGSLIWKANIGQDLNDMTPVVVGRVVFVAANSTWLLALDAAHGKVLWRTNLNEVIKSAPTYASGLVLVNASATTYALDARTGLVRWRFHETGSGWPTSASPTVQGQLVYVAQGTKPIVYALNLATGKQVWAYAVAANNNTRLISTPVVAGPDIVAGTWDGRLFALNALSGALAWTYNVNAALPRGAAPDGIAGSPAASNGVVYMGTYDGDVLALDVQTGRLLWARIIDAPILGVPVLLGATLYVSGGQTLFALSAKSGTPRWHLALGDVRSDLALGQNRLYAATVQGYIYALD
jgi:eukaryotic-like serine/threonine-protein kinase